MTYNSLESCSLGLITVDNSDEGQRVNKRATRETRRLPNKSVTTSLNEFA